MFKYGGDVKRQGIMHGMNGLRDGGVATTMADALGMANGGIIRQGYNQGLSVRPNHMGGPYSSNFYESIDDRPDTNIPIPKRMTLKEKIFREAENPINLPGPDKIDTSDPKVAADLKAVDGDVQKYYADQRERNKIAEEKAREEAKSIFAPSGVYEYDREEGPVLKDPNIDQGEIVAGENFGNKSNLPRVTSNKEKDAARLKRAYEILGVDDAKKDAVYNSLIDLSQAQAIDTKDISGSINRAVGALSRRADKVTDLKDKGKAALASGTIQEMFRDKETAADKKLRAYAEATGKTKEYVARKELGLANSLQDAVSLLRKEKKGVPITSDDIVATAMAYGEEKGIPFKQRITTEQKRAKVGKGKDYETVVDLVQALELNPDGTDDGIYVVGTSIIQVEKGIAKLKG